MNDLNKFFLYAEGLEYEYHSPAVDVPSLLHILNLSGVQWIPVKRHGYEEYLRLDRIGRIRMAGQNLDF